MQIVRLVIVYVRWLNIELLEAGIHVIFNESAMFKSTISDVEVKKIVNRFKG